MSAAGIRAGRAFVEIGVSDKLTAALNAAQAKLKRFGDSVTSLGLSLGSAGLAIGAPIAFATMSFARFDDAVRGVGAVTGATQSQLASLKATAAELGRTTSFTAVEVASLMTELGRAGFNPAEINAATKAVLNLSRATTTDAAQSASIVANTLRQFSLEAGEAARVADVLTMTASKTNNTVEALGEALNYAGPVAAQLGMSLEDTTAILGVLGNVGIQGSAAGTALRRLSIIAASEGAKLKEVFNVDNSDAKGQLKPLVQILDEIGKSMEGSPVAEQTAKMNEAFGLLGITSASVLAKSAAGVSDLATQLQNAAGTAQKASDAMDGGIGGAFRRILSAAEGVMNAVGEAISGPVSAVTDALTTVLGSITQFVAGNQQLMVAVTSTAAVLIGAAGGLLALGVAAKVTALGIGGAAIAAKAAGVVFGVFTGAIKLAQVSMLLMRGTMLASQGTAAGLAAAMVTLNAAQAISPALTALASTAFTVLGAVVTALSAPLATTLGFFGSIGAAALSAAASAATAWSTILAPILPLVAAIAAAIAIVGGLVTVFGIAAARAGAFSAAWSGIKGVLSELVGIARDTFGGVMAAITAGEYLLAAKVLWAGIKAAFWSGAAAVAEAVGSMLSNLLPGLWKFAKSLLSVLGDVFKMIPKMLWAALTRQGDLATMLHKALMGAGDFASGLGDRAQQARDELKQLKGEAEAAKKAVEDKKKAKEKQEQINAAIEQRKKEAADAAAGKTSERAQLQAAGANSAQLEEFDTATAQKAEAEMAKTIEDRVSAIKKETEALEKGEDAAERSALATQGATDAQLLAIEAAQKHHAAVKMAADIRDRIKSLEDEARAARFGAQAADRMKLAIEGATSAQLKALEAAEEAADAARKAADDRDAGKKLKDSLRTPLEIFRDEMIEARRLLEAGAIDSETFDRAKGEASEKFIKAAGDEESRKEIAAAEARRVDALLAAGKINAQQAAAMLGGVGNMLAEAARQTEGAKQTIETRTEGTFDGFALGRLGGVDPRAERTAKASEDTARNTATIAGKLDRLPKPLRLK